MNSRGCIFSVNFTRIHRGAKHSGSTRVNALRTPADQDNNCPNTSLQGFWTVSSKKGHTNPRHIETLVQVEEQNFAAGGTADEQNFLGENNE